MPEEDKEAREALQDGLRMAAVALGEANIPYALCGGYAAWARGAPEPAHDADFVIREADVDRARAAIADAGLEVREPAEDWLFKAFHKGELVDILFRMVGEPVGQEVFDRCDVLEVCAVRMPVLSATDLMSTKLRVMHEHYCDFAQLLPVARALREQVDWAQIDRECRDQPFAEAFLYLLRRLSIIDAADAPG